MGLVVRKGNPIFATNTFPVDLSNFERLKEVYYNMLFKAVDEAALNIEVGVKSLSIHFMGQDVTKRYTAKSDIEWLLNILRGFIEVPKQVKSAKVKTPKMAIPEQSAYDYVNKVVKEGGYVFIENDTLYVRSSSVQNGQTGIAKFFQDHPLYESAILPLIEKSEKARRLDEERLRLLEIFKKNNIKPD